MPSRFSFSRTEDDFPSTPPAPRWGQLSLPFVPTRPHTSPHVKDSWGLGGASQDLLVGRGAAARLLRNLLNVNVGLGGAPSGSQDVRGGAEGGGGGGGVLLVPPALLVWVPPEPAYRGEVTCRRKERTGENVSDSLCAQHAPRVSAYIRGVGVQGEAAEGRPRLGLARSRAEKGKNQLVYRPPGEKRPRFHSRFCFGFHW